ncbi:biosynthetic-type acetolactate synthase large subunit [Marivirga sp. S37H4]|uniref:Acetolactate synthase n=1 Tax=Marivirga aurantiaca TaxID=2802615 RepID=A0A935CD10_9BACT|nr:biosynthetic-type acetolactate synthase large subunit [Marivirga aurantiaca]MBK6266473.1 biosynthetic-type acetolactate synthase large subunit [Marivirga aurantiaca]
MEPTQLTKTQVKKTTITGAEALVRALIAEKVDTIFGYPGGAIMPVYDALYYYEKELKHIMTRHEQGATHAAQGYARISGKVGVCLATSGPGATNLITGLADAQLDSTAIVCITGQVSSKMIGTDAFQETDIVSISMPVTKWNIQITKAKDIPAAIAKAFYIAKSGKPGPVLIDITKDAQFETFEFTYEPCHHIRSYVPNPQIDSKAIELAARVIDSAKKPLIVFGHGILLADARKEFQAFVEKTGIPAAWTIMGLSALNTDHPLNIGMLGMHGNYAPNIMTNECDVLIAVGMRFDDRVTGDVSRYAKQAKIIHLEIDPAEINKNVTVDVAVLGNCKESLDQLTKAITPKEYPDWLHRAKELITTENEMVIKDELFPPENDKITMGEVIRRISDISKGAAIIVTDVGQHQMIAQRYYNFRQWKSNVTSGGLGTMGFALPAAIGAKFGAPHRQVIAVIGDGGFQMTIQELGTLFQTRVDVKILILNNEFLGMVRQWQDLFFEKRYSSVDMVNPDFQIIAKGYGITAEKVTEREDLESAIHRFLSHDGSFLLEVLVGKENNIFPMIPTGASVSEIRLE